MLAVTANAANAVPVHANPAPAERTATVTATQPAARPAAKKAAPLVAEPSSWSMLLVGAGVLLLPRHRRSDNAVR